MKFCIIGLGRFGYSLATVLAENGIEVIAIDSNESIVSSIRDNVTQAICMRVVDEASLRSVGVDEMDTVVVAMGENFAQSILITALLKKKMSIPRVIARAINDIHKDILKLVGADQIVLPEKEIGIKLADTLSSPFIETVRLTPEFSISQIVAPKKFVGKTINELNLFHHYRVHCIGIRQDDVIISLDPEYVIADGAKLMFSGKNENLEKIAKL
jgi:trk system potassium uptake protein TrkA